MAEPLPDQPRLSIIIPVLNEADCLDQSLADLFSRAWLRRNCEVIVSDGGSADHSLEIAASYPCRVIRSEPGRAEQMNIACASARGKLLLFLHADSRLPDDFGRLIPSDAEWGFFRLRLSGEATAFRIIETAINLRTGLSKIAGGDQGIFFSRRLFESLGGFPSIPLMEDVAICKQARRLARPSIIESAIISSSRRWQEQGIIRTVLLMWSLRFAYWLGVDPVRLHRIYYPGRG